MSTAQGCPGTAARWLLGGAMSWGRPSRFRALSSRYTAMNWLRVYTYSGVYLPSWGLAPGLGGAAPAAGEGLGRLGDPQRSGGEPTGRGGPAPQASVIRKGPCVRPRWEPGTSRGMTGEPAWRGMWLTSLQGCGACDRVLCGSLQVQAREMVWQKVLLKEASRLLQAQAWTSRQAADSPVHMVMPNRLSTMQQP